MSYNQSIITRLVDYVKYILVRVEDSAYDGSSIELVKYQTVDTNNLDVNYLAARGMTGSFTLKFYFKVTVKGIVTEFDENLEVPKMINNVFVIDGDFRVPTNTLENDPNVAVYSRNIRISQFLNIRYEEDEHEQDGYKLTIEYYDDEEPIIIDGTEENFQKYTELLKLDDDQINKIKIKLDTDEVPSILNRKTVLALIHRGTDKGLDNMIDKKIFSPESNLMNYLWNHEVKRPIMSRMRHKFYQFSHIYLRDIQNAIDRYFRIASEQNISFVTQINPLVMDAMRYKIQIPGNVAYNETMADIIDPANTPINGHVNEINELNVCVEIINDELFIKCYKFPTGEPVKVKYIEYCTKRVLLNYYWNYDTNKVKDTDGKVKFKQRLKIKEAKADSNFDLIEPKADDKLSITTRRIPMGNVSDSVRIHMGTAMMKQAVELAEPEAPLITTGHDDSDFELSTLITRHVGEEVTVTKIQGDKIFVKDQTGNVIFYDIPAPTPGMNQSVISFDPGVKVGDVIKDGDPVVIPHMIRNKTWDLGSNVNVVYLNYLGYTYEDAQVISKSLADRMMHYQLIDVTKEIYQDDIIKYITKVGSKVKSRDILINLQTRLKVSRSISDTYTADNGLLRGLGINYKQSNLITPNNCDEGYIVDCRIEIPEGRNLSNEESLKLIQEYSVDNKSSDYDWIPDKFKSLKVEEYPISDRAVGYISYKILQVDRCKPGDKTTNRYGGKGEIALVMPDECMPLIIDSNGLETRAEMILNPHGVLHRKNLSQIWEVTLTKCIKRIYTKVSELISQNHITEAKQFLNKFYGSKFDSMTDEEFIDNHRKGVGAYAMEVGFFSKVSYDQVQQWMKDLNISETNRVFLPDIVTVERKEGLVVFPMDRYVKEDGDNPKYHELGWCESECVTGSEYIVKLFHSAKYSGKSTSSIKDLDEPILGRGNYRVGAGQKIGEMETWILLETGTEAFLQKQSADLITNQYVFLNEMLLAGYAITDKDDNPLLSNYRSKLKALKELDEQTKANN